MELQPITVPADEQVRDDEPGSVYIEAQRMKTIHMVYNIPQEAPQEASNNGHIDKSSVTDMAVQKVANTKKLIICFLGIFVSYFVYGLLQEKITRGKYGDGDTEEKFTFALTLVFVQCVINVIFAQTAIQLSGPLERDNSPQKYYALMAFSYLGAMVASNASLQYVSYPTQVLGKSAKPIPVMILGVLMARKRYPLQKYLFVLMIVIGVALFMYKDKKVESESASFFGSGEILLLVSLFLDGITGGVQDKLRSEHRSQTHRMMLYMNGWSVIYLVIGLLVTGEGVAFLGFASRYPNVLFNLLLFSLCSAVGQNFIFMTVTAFGPLTCSICTTTRKFFTILFSVFLFQNPMSMRQWGGTFCVFVGLTLDSFYGKERKAPKTHS